MPNYEACPDVPANHLRGSVRRTVIDHDDLLRTALGQMCLSDALQHLVEGSEFVINRNDDRDFHGLSRTTNSDWPKGGRTSSSRRDVTGTKYRSKISIWLSDCASRLNTRAFTHQPTNPGTFT